MLAEGHFMCRPAGVSQRALATLCADDSLLPAPSSSAQLLVILHQVLARAVLNVWSSDVVWELTFQQGWVEITGFSSLALLEAVFKNWLQTKASHLKISSTCVSVSCALPACSLSPWEEFILICDQKSWALKMLDRATCWKKPTSHVWAFFVLCYFFKVWYFKTSLACFIWNPLNIIFYSNLLCFSR